LAKLTDYAIVLLTYFVREPRAWSASELSAESSLPTTTVAKVLKMLTKGHLLVSHRGKLGGYTLAKAARAVSVADVIEVMEGPLCLTECSAKGSHLCAIEGACPVRGHWRRINVAVRSSLAALSLAEMADPLPRAGAGGGGTKLLKIAARR
jgi:FeS assembly SUF system regulator